MFNFTHIIINVWHLIIHKNIVTKTRGSEDAVHLDILIKIGFYPLECLTRKFKFIAQWYVQPINFYYVTDL